MSLPMLVEREEQPCIAVRSFVTMTSIGSGDARIESGALPGGTYATVIHVGHPSSLNEATADLLEWGRREDVTWDMTYGPEGERWACRPEEYLSDPVQVPDMGAWQTQLAFKLK